jgi:hypothetical protein
MAIENNINLQNLKLDDTQEVSSEETTKSEKFEFNGTLEEIEKILEEWIKKTFSTQ